MDKDTFIATLIHDLRTPAYAQMNMLNLFLDGHFGNLSKLQTDKINLMRESCKYSVDLISNILDSYRYSCGNVKLNVESFDIIELISNLKISMLNLAEEKSQRLVFKKNINSCYIMADRLQIKRVLINILSNALKYGFSSTEIEIDAVQKQKNIEIFIKNRGIQIPKNELGGIFKKSKHKTTYFDKSGTGLGLYLSKQIIDLHKGCINADSFSDGTCVFSFTLPTG